MNKEFLRSFRSVWGIGALVAATGPLALAIPDLTPPWPRGAEAIALIFCVVSAILAARFGAEHIQARSGAARRSRTVTIIGSAALLLGLAASLAYLAASSSYVVEVTQPANQQERKLRFVVGTELRPGIKSSTDIAGQLLPDHMYEPENIWTPGSLLRARLTVFVSFALTFALLTFGASMLATLARRHPRRAAASRS